MSSSYYYFSTREFRNGDPDKPWVHLVAPEYEACKRLAEASGLPLAEVYRIVQTEGEARLRREPRA